MTVAGAGELSAVLRRHAASLAELETFHHLDLVESTIVEALTDLR